jgi:hypothetical protein
MANNKYTIDVLKKYLKNKYGETLLNYDGKTSDDVISSGKVDFYKEYKPSWEWVFESYKIIDWKKNDFLLKDIDSFLKKKY